MKIQYKSKPRTFEIRPDKRYLLFRIDPSELSWWKRTFRNPWRYAFRSYEFVGSFDTNINDCLRYLFSPEEAEEFVSKYDTYEKIIVFLTTEFNKARDMFYKENNRWKF